MRRLVALIGWLVALPAAAGLTFAHTSAPALFLAHLGMIAAEKSLILGVAGLLAMAAGWLCFRPGSRVAGAALTLVGLAIFVASVPLVVGPYRAARARAVDLDLGRALKGGLETGAHLPARVRTFVYRNVDGHPLALDAWPPDPVRHRPATPVVVIHGGGWAAGERSEVLHTDAWLASQGFAVFDVDYRLVPATTGAGALADVRCALAWIKDKAKLEGFDVATDRTVLLGRSAGGHLALLAAYTEREPTRQAGPCDTTGVTIAGVVALYPITDLASAYAAPANPAAYPLDDKIRAFAGGTPEAQETTYRALSPLAHVTRATPPTLLIHGLRDQVVPFSQSRKLAEALAANGVAHDLLVLPWAGHRFDFVVDGPADQLTQAMVLQFLRELPLVSRVAPKGALPRQP